MKSDIDPWAPSRRDVCRWGLAGLAATTCPLLACASKTPYNVLFITIDDLGNWAGCLGGHPDALTPNIDALAASGRLFRRAYSPGANCNGTRTAVLTGLRPWTSDVYDVKDAFPGERLDQTLPAFFRAHGYKTIGGGKVFHLPQPAVWDEYFRPKAPDLYQHRIAPETYGFPDNVRFNWGPIKFPPGKTWDGQLASWATKQLGREHDKPFFMGVGFFMPHMPWWVPRRYFRKFKPARVTLPRSRRDDMDDIPQFARRRAHRQDFARVAREGQWRPAVASYLAASHFVDAMVGKVLDALAASPYADNTIVTLWSDHGFALGQKRNWRKFLLWEHIVQVPFIVRVPQMAEPGTASERPVDLLHLYPTLADLCDLPRPSGVEGKSLRPLVERPQAKWPLPAISTCGWNSHAVRTERWRYIRYGDASEELYDHDNDPLERSNLADRPEHAALKLELARWLPELG